MRKRTTTISELEKVFKKTPKTHTKTVRLAQAIHDLYVSKPFTSLNLRGVIKGANGTPIDAKSKMQACHICEYTWATLFNFVDKQKVSIDPAIDFKHTDPNRRQKHTRGYKLHQRVKEMLKRGIPLTLDVTGLGLIQPTPYNTNRDNVQANDELKKSKQAIRDALEMFTLKTSDVIVDYGNDKALSKKPLTQPVTTDTAITLDPELYNTVKDIADRVGLSLKTVVSTYIVLAILNSPDVLADVITLAEEKK